MADETSVRVAVRIRPQIARERIDMCRVCTSVTPGEPQVWLGSDKAFTYDYVFDMPTPQEDVYSTCVECLVDGCFDGYNATVLAYGQTGSGKTYTMGTGLDIDTNADTLGIIPRAVFHMFTGIEERKASAREQGIPVPDFKVTAHFMELYNEEVIDLFDPNYKGISKSSVKIHEDAGGGIYVTGITTRNVATVEETMQCLRTGAVSRTTGSTNMNAQSSRSHAIFTLIMRQQRIVPAEDNFDTENGVPEFETLTAKFHFVDLAGSERLKRTGATGERAREGISINCGLLALGNVISALGDASKRVSHVPYRDSKLTRLLQDSLGGNSRTLMIACVSPSDTDFMETLNTLKYANRARNIKNKVTVNQDKTSKTIALLRQEIQTLQIELMEYKQGKRLITADGTEGVNDMFHENQMLLTETENLRTRMKALQETIEVLTVKNTQLLAEKAVGEWGHVGEGEEGESDVIGVVHGYLKEIEELRAKLCESENLCQQLRKQLNNKNNVSSALRTSLSMSPMHGVAMTGSMMGSCIVDEEETQSITDLIEEAKRDLKNDLDEVGRKKRGGGVGGDGPLDLNEDDVALNNDMDEDVDNNEEMEEEEESSDESGEDKGDEDDSDDERSIGENYNAELADLTSEISIKQKLIESLETTQRRLETMKFQYEEKLNMMMNRIKATQDERDKVLSTMKQNGPSGGPSDDRVKMVRQEYQKKLSHMEGEVKKLRAAQKEHAKLMRERSAHERQLKSLKSEMADMKRNKVKLIQKMKEESNRAKKEDMKKNKEIAQLRKEHRKKENYIRSLEADNRLKTTVLRRKTEEISNLKKAPRRQLSNRAAGRLRRKLGIGDTVTFSPKMAKQKWQAVEQSINKIAYNKQTVSSLERDMDRWLRERESLSRQLEKIKRRRERVDPADASAYNDLNDQIDACKANIDYIHENITECQENIMSMEENKEVMDILDPTRVTSGLSEEELHYLISKLLSMSVNQATVAAQRQASIAELEGKMKQMEQTTSVQEQLLAHVLRDNDMNVYHLMSSLVAGDDNTPGSTESSRSNSPVEGVLGSYPASLELSSDSLKRRGDKARRKTATTEDMLFTDGGEKPLSASTTALHHTPDPFLSVPPTATSQDASSSSAPPTLDPRMTTSLEGTLGRPSEANPHATLINESNAYAFARGVPRVTSAPNPLKPLVTNRGGKSSPSLTRKHYEKQELASSPKIGRKHLAALSSTVLSVNRQISSENQSQIDVTPPTSPLTYRRNLSREENVFNRLTSATSTIRDSYPDTGVINPHAGRVNQRSVLACTHVAQGHSKAVLSVFATDDKIFSASKDRTAKIWDLVRGQEILTLGGHPNNVNCVKYSERMNLCFSVSSSFIKVWDLRENPVKCAKTLSSSGLTSNGPVFSGGNSRTLQMPPGETQINDIALSESSNVLYSAAGNIVRIWDLRKFMSVGKLSGAHQAAVMCLAVESAIPNQTVVVTGSKDHYIKVFDVGTNNSGLISPRRSLDPPHYDGVQSLALYGDTLFSGSRDMCIKKWDLNKGEHVQSLNNAHKDWVCALCFLPGGQIVLSGCRGGTIKMWSADSCHLIGELRAHASPINAITTNSTCIFTASNDCTIGLWRMRTSYDVSPELSDSAC